MATKTTYLRHLLQMRLNHLSTIKYSVNRKKLQNVQVIIGRSNNIQMRFDFDTVVSVSILHLCIHIV